MATSGLPSCSTRSEGPSKSTAQPLITRYTKLENSRDAFAGGAEQRVGNDACTVYVHRLLGSVPTSYPSLGDARENAARARAAGGVMHVPNNGYNVRKLNR